MQTLLKYLQFISLLTNFARDFARKLAYCHKGLQGAIAIRRLTTAKLWFLLFEFENTDSMLPDRN